MSLHISTVFQTGRTLSATIERLSDGFFWNGVSFVSSPSFASKKISLTEGSSENAESYEAEVTGLGDPGVVRVRVHDEDSSNVCVGAMETGVLNGVECDPGTIDELLRRDQTNVASPADRSPLNALRKLNNRVEITGAGVLNVYEEDDTTVALAQDVTEDANANPIIEVDTQ